jgi:hypothetical protein
MQRSLTTRCDAFMMLHDIVCTHCNVMMDVVTIVMLHSMMLTARTSGDG